MNNQFNNEDKQYSKEDIEQILRVVLKNELNINDKQIDNKIIDILRLNLKCDMSEEIKELKHKIKSNMTVYNFFSNLTVSIISLLLGFYWIVGFVIAKGFWSTFFCFIPFYAWYLVVEAYLTKYGLL